MYIKKYFDGYVSKMRENYKAEGKAGKNGCIIFALVRNNSLPALLFIKKYNDYQIYKYC